MADDPSSPAWQPQRSRNAPAQLQNLRNYLNSDPQRPEYQQGVDTIDQEISLRSSVLERQRRDLDAHLQGQDIPSINEDIPPSSSHTSLIRSRRRAFRPNTERLQRHRERYTQALRAESSDSLTNTQRGTTPSTFTGTLADEYGAESQLNREQRFRAKRRKLDDGTFDDETRNISYGDEGRVTPGSLKMDIIRCDGGDGFEAPSGSAQLVLQDDKSVYSTKENRCNLLLKHIGGIPFSLTKITIKAPSDRVDSPIQEGMVFVAMDDDKLIDRTSHYDRYSPRSYRSHNVYRRRDTYRPSQEYLNSARSPLRSIDRSRYLQDPQPPWLRYTENEPELETSLIPGFDISLIDPLEQDDSPSHTPRSPVSWRDLDAEYSLRYHIDRQQAIAANNDTRDNASVTSNESGEDYVPPPRERGANNNDDLNVEFSLHRSYLNLFRSAHERGDHDIHVLHSSRRARQDWRNIDFSTRRATGRIGYQPNSFQQDDSINNGNIPKTTNEHAPQTASSVSEILAPHARFSMAEAQTSIAINFDPPVAGRYILIKLWAACPASNIDIQCIIPQGYGGPRFFPSIDMR